MEMRTDYCGNITSKYENQNVTIYGKSYAFNMDEIANVNDLLQKLER